MPALSAADVLELWSAGMAGDPVVRALSLLAAASGDASPAELAELALGEINRRTLELRAKALDRPLECRTACPACGEELEVEIDPGDLRWDQRPAPRQQGAAGELEAELRPVRAADLLAVHRADDPEAAALALAERCVANLRRGGEEVAVGDLTEGELAQLSRLLAEADPAAEVLLELRCAACGHVWPEPLDLASFFLTELDQLARELLAQIHLLARAYGWRESDILALPARRRAAYLELLAREGAA